MKSWTILTISAALLWAAVTGCIDQEKEVAKYRAVLAGPATMPATMPAVLTMTRAMQMANARYEPLAISGEDYLQAMIDQDRAIATFLPTVSLQPTYYLMANPKLPSLGGFGTEFAPTHAYDTPIAVQQSIFNGFRDANAFKAALSNADQRKATLRNLQASVLVEVASVYYQVLRSEKLAEVLANSVMVQSDRVHDLQNQFDAGVARKVDLLQAQAQESATKNTLISARSDVIKGRSTLAFLIGAQKVECPLTDQFDVPAVRPLEDLEQEAQAKREDLVAAVASVGTARHEVDVAIGEWFPSVSFNLNTFLSRQSFPAPSNWAAVFTINQPLFTGGRIYADVRTAMSRLRQAELNESLTRRQIVEDVRIAYQNLQAAKESVAQLRIELAAAEEGYHQADNTYKAGTGTNLEVLIANDQWLRAQVQLASQEFEYKVAYLTLLRTVGVLELTDPAGPKLAPASAPASQPATAPAAVGS